MQFGDSEATRILAAIQKMLGRRLKSNAMVQTTWGTVADVSSDYRMASAYLYGETDGAYISEGFRVPEMTYVTIGDVIKVAIDYGTGERWVESVHAGSAYPTILLDHHTGTIYIGDGVFPPEPLSLDPGDPGIAGIDASLDGVGVVDDATTFDFESPFVVTDGGGGVAVIGFDLDALPSSGFIMKPVMANDPGIVTTHGLAVYIPLVTVEGEAIMGEVNQ